jgi:glycosyltransferase involved in cell wall biosynthesis
MDVIDNGVERYPQPNVAHRRSICVAMGRICREKGCDIALRAARRAGRSLLLAGRVFPYPDHVAYFERKIQPLLDSSRRFIGPVNAVLRRRLLARASCVLIPSLAPETSSLVAMEAAMGGAPVIAFRSGALPQIVEHGRTGFLVNDEQEMAEAISRAGEIDSAECRRIAEERFSADAMCARYFELYQRMIAPAERSSDAHAVA